MTTNYAWLEYLRDYRAERPELTFADAKREAEASFNKKPNRTSLLDEPSCEDEQVQRFYKVAALPLGARVQDRDGRRGTIVKRAGQQWVSRDKLPLIRWDGQIPAKPVPWEEISEVPAQASLEDGER